MTTNADGPGAGISKADQSTLNWLRWNWEEDYLISFDGAVWTAVPSTAPEAVLSERDPLRLRRAMALDYATRAIRSGATALRWREFNSAPPEPV